MVIKEKIYEKFINELMIVCKKRKFELNKIGSVGANNEYPIFSVAVNNIPKPDKVVCFSAGIHGTEIAGPWAVLKFLETLDMRKIKNIKIIIFPVANPSGFDRQTRMNYIKKDANIRFYDDKMEGEAKVLYDAVKNENIFFFHALHEDPDETRFYIYSFQRDNLLINSEGNTHAPSSFELQKIKSLNYNSDDSIYPNILELGKKYFEINTDEIIDNYKAINGIVINRWDHSFEDRMFRDGVMYVMCTETPEKMDLQPRIDLNVEIMNKVIKFARSNIKTPVRDLSVPMSVQAEN